MTVLTFNYLKINTYTDWAELTNRNKYDIKRIEIKLNFKKHSKKKKKKKKKKMNENTRSRENFGSRIGYPNYRVVLLPDIPDYRVILLPDYRVILLPDFRVLLRVISLPNFRGKKSGNKITR